MTTLRRVLARFSDQLNHKVDRKQQKITDVNARAARSFEQINKMDTSVSEKEANVELERKRQEAYEQVGGALLNAVF